MSAIEQKVRPVRVLLADDVADVRELLTVGLARTGRYEIVGEAEDGEQALELAAALDPDVMLLDVAMPKLDGFEVLERLQQTAPRCRVVVLSGFGARRFEQRALQLGADAYVEKSVGLAAIARTLDEVCEDLRTPPEAAEDGAAAVAAHPPVDSDATDELLAYVVHELNTPVTVIRGYAEALRDGTVDTPDLSRTAVDAIVRNADQLRAMLLRFHEARAIEIGELELDLRPVGLSALTREIVSDLASTIGSHEVCVVAEEEVEASVDPTRIRQVVSNLLGNAVKYSPAGSPIDVAVTRQDEDAVISVIDRGPGIATDDREAVFAKFTRLDRSEKGTGLGLYISRGLAHAHGGDLTVEDVTGGGCRFVLRLPLGTASP